MNLGLKSCCRPKAAGKPPDPEQYQHPDRKGQMRGCHSVRLQRAPLSPLFLPPPSPTRGLLGSAPSLPRAGLRPGSAGAPIPPVPTSRAQAPLLPPASSSRAAARQIYPGGPRLTFCPLALTVPLCCSWLPPVLFWAQQDSAAGRPRLSAVCSAEFCSQPCSRTCPGPRLRQDRGQHFPAPHPAPSRQTALPGEPGAGRARAPSTELPFVLGRPR